MKSFLLLFLFINYSILSQTNLNAIFTSLDLIQETGKIGTTREISTDANFTAAYQIAIDNKGEFKYHFPSSLNVVDNIIICSINSKN